MPTIEDIKAQVKKIENADTFGTKKEIKYLPEVMRDDETVLGLTSGLMDGNTWLIVCTEYRIIFLDKGMIYGLKQVETPLEKINSIEQKTGLIFGKISIWDGSSKMIIDNVMKGTVKPFVNTLNAAIDSLKKNSSGGAPQQSSSVSDELQKLAKLKEDGVLTDDEFAEQKKKLLAA